MKRFFSLNNFTLTFRVTLTLKQKLKSSLKLSNNTRVLMNVGKNYTTATHNQKLWLEHLQLQSPSVPQEVTQHGQCIR